MSDGKNTIKYDQLDTAGLARQLVPDNALNSNTVDQRHVDPTGTIISNDYLWPSDIVAGKFSSLGSTQKSTIVRQLTIAEADHINTSHIIDWKLIWGREDKYAFDTNNPGVGLEIILNGQFLSPQDPVKTPTYWDFVELGGACQSVQLNSQIVLKENDLLVIRILDKATTSVNYPVPGQSPPLSYVEYVFPADITLTSFDTTAASGTPDFVFGTGLEVAGRFLGVWLNGVRLYHGTDYFENGYGGYIHDETIINFPGGYPFQKDDHLYFQIFASGPEGASGSGGTGAVGSNVPIGFIGWYAAGNPPTDWLECNGQWVSKQTYATLWGVIGDTYLDGAAASATAFRLPNLAGKFARGWSHGLAPDPGRVFGSSQDDTFKSHTHNVNGYLLVSDGVGPLPWYNWSNPNLATNYPTTLATGGDETRPKNLALLPCIKAKGNVEQVSLTSGNPVGSIITLPTAVIPEGYLECNGQSVAASAYPALFAMLGTTYGGNSVNFNVPNYQGMFQRGWSHGTSGAYYPDGTAPIGSVQDGQIQSHTHPYIDTTPESPAQGSPPYSIPTGTSGTHRQGNPATTSPTGGLETRPNNMSVVYAIKAYETDLKITNFAATAGSVPASGIVGTIPAAIVNMPPAQNAYSFSGGQTRSFAWGTHKMVIFTANIYGGGSAGNQFQVTWKNSLGNVIQGPEIMAGFWGGDGGSGLSNVSTVTCPILPGTETVEIYLSSGNPAGMRIIAIID